MGNYDNFYSGTASTFEKEYSDIFPSYKSFKRIGTPTSTQTANQIEEVNKLLNQGMKTIELSALSPELFETIPQEHLKDINRLSKLTGNEMTVHGPTIDPSGFKVTERGVEGWSAYEREDAENRLKNSVIRAHDLNPEGNIPVVIHASSLPAGEIKKGEALYAVNQETGQLTAFRKEEKYYPEGKITHTPESELKMMNNTQWTDQISTLLHNQRYGEEELKDASRLLGEKNYNNIIKGKKIETKEMTPEDQQKLNVGISHLNRANAFCDEVEAKFRGLYHQAWKYTDKKTKEKLNEIREIWEAGTSHANPEARLEFFNMAIGGLRQIGATRETPNAPQLYKPVEEFALEHSAQTIGNVAFAGYEKFKNTAPIVAVENFFPNMAFSSAEQLSKLIKESRKIFVEDAVKKGIAKSEAEKEAEKLIGATWDIGHLNMLKKGYPEKEAEKIMMEETKKIAPLVKHVHISDNFGYQDSHLPPGMGNVPVKKIMEELEKRGFSGKQIMEAGGFVAQFKVSPLPYILEAMDSPMYYAHMTPKWSDAQRMYGHYSTGYGSTLPEQHFGMYGAGFSALPTELGGQTKGAEGRRFAGTPME